jgi:hypothetical protein
MLPSLKIPRNQESGNLTFKPLEIVFNAIIGSVQGSIVCVTDNMGLLKVAQREWRGHGHGDWWKH